MGKICLDEAIFAKLVLPEGSVELCDSSGRTRGYFLTPEQYQRYLYAWAKEQFSDEQSQQGLESARANGGKSTAEVLAFLEGLERGVGSRG
jgi:hypothetical protein